MQRFACREREEIGKATIEKSEPAEAPRGQLGVGGWVVVMMVVMVGLTTADYSVHWPNRTRAESSEDDVANAIVI